MGIDSDVGGEVCACVCGVCACVRASWLRRWSMAGWVSLSCLRLRQQMGRESGPAWWVTASAISTPDAPFNTTEEYGYTGKKGAIRKRQRSDEILNCQKKTKRRLFYTLSRSFHPKSTYNRVELIKVQELRKLQDLNSWPFNQYPWALLAEPLLRELAWLVVFTLHASLHVLKIFVQHGNVNLGRLHL